MRKIVFAIIAVMVASPVVASHEGGKVVAEANEVATNPGLVSAGSSLYGADTALDTILVNAGVADPGQVAYERASEVAQAQRNNNSEGMEKASEQLNRIAQVASNQSVQGLQKAEQVLKAVKQRTPDQANVGLDQALSNVEKAQSRKPEDVGRPESPGDRPEQPSQSGKPLG